MAATGHEDEHHVIAHGKAVDAFADLFDDAGGFMPEHHRHRTGTGAVDDGEVGVAEARGLDLDQDFARAGARQIDLDDLERLRARVRDRRTHFAKHRGLDAHELPLPVTSSARPARRRAIAGSVIARNAPRNQRSGPAGRARSRRPPSDGGP